MSETDAGSGLVNNTPLVQQVRDKLGFWKSLEKSSFAVKLIQRGLTVPFSDKRKVNRLCKRNIRSRKTSKTNRIKLRRELKDLLTMQVIERITEDIPLFENHIFCKTKPNGKIRVIFDMKQLNTFIRLPKLKMFTFSKSNQEFLRNSVACRIDLSNAFWHIGINNKFKHYFSFRFGGHNYCWKAMPFGLKTAPYLFCKMMGTIIKHIREKFNIPIFYYMDDILVLAPSPELGTQYIKIVIDHLQNAGLSINFDKSIITPVPYITFLGIDIDLEAKIMVPSLDNISACIKQAKQFSGSDKKSLKEFQSLIGTLNFAAPYIQFGKLKLSPLHKFHPYFNREGQHTVPLESKQHLKFWSEQHSYTPITIPNFITLETTFHTDASQTGWGAVIQTQEDESLHVQGSWSTEDSHLHINVKELKAVLLTLKSCSHLVQNHLIKIFSDNKVTVTWLNKEAAIRSEAARDILFQWLKLKKSLNLQIKAYYIKGTENLTADALSRSTSLFAETSITHETFSQICKIAEIQPNIDLFANDNNHHCPLYFSSAPDPEAKGQNALSQSWDEYKHVYAFPPTHLINKTIYRFLNSKCSRMLLIVPNCKATWHSNIKKLGAKTIPFTFKNNNFLHRLTPSMDPSAPNPCDLRVYLL